MTFPCYSVSKESACNAGNTEETGSIPGSGRSLGEGNGNPLQYSCLENPMERGAWRVTGHGVAKSQIEWSDLAHINGLSADLFNIISPQQSHQVDNVIITLQMMK